VAFAEELVRRIKTGINWSISVQYRDLNLMIPAHDEQAENDDDEQRTDVPEEASTRRSKRLREMERKNGRSVRNFEVGGSLYGDE